MGLCSSLQNDDTDANYVVVDPQNDDIDTQIKITQSKGENLLLNKASNISYNFEDNEDIYDRLIKCIIWGYLRFIEQKSTSVKTPNNCINLINNDVMKLIFNYYGNRVINSKFDQINCGKNLIIRKNTVTKSNNDSKFTVCPFGFFISDQLCKKFVIAIKLKSINHGIFLGYVTEYDLIKDWTSKHNSNSFNIWAPIGNEFFYHKDQFGGKKKYFHSFGPKWDRLSIKLIFDFPEDCFDINIEEKVSNDSNPMSFSLHGKKRILPCFGLCNKGDSIKIVKEWTFY